MTNTALPFKNAHPCNCSDCRCGVTVVSHHSVCRACRAGGHDLRSWKQVREERRQERAASHAA